LVFKFKQFSFKNTGVFRIGKNILTDNCREVNTCFVPLFEEDGANMILLATTLYIIL
jgi:hypothetical protein